MSLTMTRTRTQTALTRLAKLLANLNGEMEFVERLKKELPAFSNALEARRTKLAADRAAVCATIKQFDPDVDYSLVASSKDWSTAYCRRGSSIETEYLRQLP